MRSTYPTPAFAWACDVLGVRPPALQGDDSPDDRRAWSTWKAHTVESAARFVPGRADEEIHVARDILLGTPAPASPAPTLASRLSPDVRDHLRVQFGRFGFVAV